MDFFAVISKLRNYLLMSPKIIQKTEFRVRKFCRDFLCFNFRIQRRRKHSAVGMICLFHNNYQQRHRMKGRGMKMTKTYSKKKKKNLGLGNFAEIFRALTCGYRDAGNILLSGRSLLPLVWFLRDFKNTSATFRNTVFGDFSKLKAPQTKILKWVSMLPS